LANEQSELAAANSSAGTQAKSTGSWIAKAGAIFAIVFLAWATIGSSWYFGFKAQICSPAGRALSAPGMPCYQPPPPGCEQASGSALSSSLCVDETYRGRHRFFNDDFVGRAFEWAFDQLDFYVTPAWNAFFISETNRKVVFGLLAGLVCYLLKKLGDDVWEYLKTSHRG
jgi:hypothetical protein